MRAAIVFALATIAAVGWAAWAEEFGRRGLRGEEAMSWTMVAATVGLAVLYFGVPAPA